MKRYCTVQFSVKEVLVAGRKGALILDTARQMFLERGYDATSLDDVAAASGVSKTTVYNNFQDKEGLFSAVVLSVTERAEQIISELGATLSGDEPVAGRLIAAARAFNICENCMLRGTPELLSNVTW